LLGVVVEVVVVTGTVVLVDGEVEDVLVVVVCPGRVVEVVLVLVVVDVTA
jgi:hypothetical protein